MMYRLKTGTVNDVEDILQIIETTQLYRVNDKEERSAIINMLSISHSVKKIEYEILNNYQRYIIVNEEDSAVAFLSYAIIGKYPPDFKIHKVYSIPSVEAKDYIKILIKHIEEIAILRGSKNLRVNIFGKEQKAYFESIGFIDTPRLTSARHSTQEGFEMIKSL